MRATTHHEDYDDYPLYLLKCEHSEHNTQRAMRIMGQPARSYSLSARDWRRLKALPLLKPSLPPLSPFKHSFLGTPIDDISPNVGAKLTMLTQSGEWYYTLGFRVRHSQTRTEDHVFIYVLEVSAFPIEQSSLGDYSPILRELPYADYLTKWDKTIYSLIIAKV